MRILLTGRNGQVGGALERSLAPLGEVIAFDRSGLDLAQPDQIVARVREVRPDVIVNPAAYTAVDKAETEPELAHAINGVAPGVFAEEAKTRGVLLVHYSTDYVFDGTKDGPYVEDDPTNPLGVYGRSKLAGEQAIAAVGGRHLILRTSWVYGAVGKNFLLTILRLAKERPELRVVDDQVGAPTWCRAIAGGTAILLPRWLADPSKDGLYHFTNTGRTSWYAFACEILRQAGSSTPVHPIPASSYATPAKRPANSVLNNARMERTFGFALPDWRASLAECMKEVVW